jgi:hypothetical protein
MTELDVYAPVAECLHETLKAKFDDRTQRAKVAQALARWLRHDAKKKPLADIEYRLNDWAERLRRMVEHMEIDFSDGKLVTKVAPSDEQTLKMLQFGSDWFEPNNDLMETIWVGLFET